MRKHISHVISDGPAAAAAAADDRVVLCKKTFHSNSQESQGQVDLKVDTGLVKRTNHAISVAFATN